MADDEYFPNPDPANAWDPTSADNLAVDNINAGLRAVANASKKSEHRIHDSPRADDAVDEKAREIITKAKVQAAGKDSPRPPRARVKEPTNLYRD